MEWLQIFKIGKQLIESGQEAEEYAFRQRYNIPYKWDKNEKKKVYKKPYIINIIANTDKHDIEIDSEKYDDDKRIKDNYFTSIAGRTKSNNFIVNAYNEKSIKNGIKSFLEKKFRKFYKELIKNNLLDENFEDSALIGLRKKILLSNGLMQKLTLYLDNLKYCIEDKKDYEKKCKDKGIKGLTTRLDMQYDDIAYIKFVVRENGKTINLSHLEDYKKYSIAYYLKMAHFEKKNLIKNAKCYFTGEQEAYAVSMPRDSINLLKLSTDKNVNSKSYFKGERYILSKEAFKFLKVGIRYIETNLSINVAEKRHYIIPDFVKEFDFSKFRSDLKPKLDLAFQNRRDYDITKRRLSRISHKGLNSLTFIGYKADERSIDVFNRIQTVTPDRYNQIVENLRNAADFFDDTKFFRHISRLYTFRSIYYLFPETKRQKNSTLVFYKKLFENHPIDESSLFDEYCKLINIYKYSGPDKDEKFYIGTTNIALVKNKEGKINPVRDKAIYQATLRYLILLKAIQQLYKTDNMEKTEITIEEQPKTQAFFDEFNFNKTDKKAIFYLGKLLRRVADVQKKADHKHKPILNRVNYSGMKPNDLKILKMELLQKLQQYNKTYSALNFAQKDLSFFEYYFCKAENNWTLSDIENVFYLFTGYGMYWEVIEPKEEKALEEKGIEKETDFELENDENETTDN